MDRGKDAWIIEGIDEIKSEMNRNRRVLGALGTRELVFH